MQTYNGISYSIGKLDGYYILIDTGKKGKNVMISIPDHSDKTIKREINKYLENKNGGE